MSAENIVIAFSKVARQICQGVTREFLAPHHVRLTLPGGIPYEAFDATAHVKSWHLLNMAECGRALSFTPLPQDPDRSYLDFHQLQKDYLAFIASTRLDMSSELYNNDTPKSPLQLEKKLLHVGNSTTSVLTEIKCPSQPAILATCIIQMVCIDKKTRHPTKFPDWWREKYENFCKDGQPLKVGTIPRPNPEKVKSFSLSVNASDIDAYFHTNGSSYLKFCLEAVAGVKQKTGGSISTEDLCLPVKSAQLGYVKESSLGDQLSVDFWEDSNSQDRLNFEILNENQDLVSNACIDFYPKF